MNFGELIKSHREKHKMSQLELSEKSKVSQALISKLENGKVHPKCHNIADLLDVFGYELKDVRKKKATRV